MTAVKTIPLLPLFDTLKHHETLVMPDWSTYPSYCSADYQHAKAFLSSYTGSQDTFNSYRREIERLLHWSWGMVDKPVCDLRRVDIEAYIRFCQQPPARWISVKKANRFVSKNGVRQPNAAWRPFMVTLSKPAVRAGQQPHIDDYQLSDLAIKSLFNILSSFYNFLIQEEVTDVNPMLLIRQKSKFMRKQQGKPKIRRLSSIQWESVITLARQQAYDPNQSTEQADYYARALFILSALYLLYLRISELVVSNRWSPCMNHFYCDHEGCWWFTVVGKGNKERHIAVSDAMLQALTNWRQHLGLSPLPSPADNRPLLPKFKGKGGVGSPSVIRRIVQRCFDNAIVQLRKDQLEEEATLLQEATVHWLRHTGISEDVKTRPREHVRDDAGHSSGVTTDQYIDIERHQRHASAKNKPLQPIQHIQADD